MPLDPTLVVGEILGQPAAEMRNPVNADYQCPFINARCVKRGKHVDGSYPVCSIWRWRGRGANVVRDLVCVCPKRFYQVDFLKDVTANCWPGQPPANPFIAHEVTMKGFGRVDFVIADIDAEARQVRQFISVELQAIDITGSVYPAYAAVLNSEQLERKPTYNLNYDNVYKRYMTQLIRKGYYHHHWGSKIVAVVQDVVFRDITERTPFPRMDRAAANIAFATYRYEDDPDEEPGHKRLVLADIWWTHHSNLQSAILYKTPPSKDVFCAKILRQLDR